MRYLIDTHIFIWYAKEQDNQTSNVLTLFDDYENTSCVRSETIRELILLSNEKPDIRR